MPLIFDAIKNSAEYSCLLSSTGALHRDCSVKPALIALLIFSPFTLGVSGTTLASSPDKAASGQACEGRRSALQSAAEEAAAARRLSAEVSSGARIGGDDGINTQLAHWRSVAATEREQRLRFELAACTPAGMSRR